MPSSGCFCHHTLEGDIFLLCVGWGGVTCRLFDSSVGCLLGYWIASQILVVDLWTNDYHSSSITHLPMVQPNFTAILISKTQKKPTQTICEQIVHIRYGIHHGCHTNNPIRSLNVNIFSKASAKKSAQSNIYNCLIQLSTFQSDFRMMKN